MPSPFPGMNPYLEQREHWQDFHTRLLVLISEAVATQAEPGYIVKLEEYLYIHELDAESRYLGRADLGVKPSLPERAGPAVALAEAPYLVDLPVAVDIEKLSRVLILDRQDRQLITAIELLSPTNKVPGTDREHDIAKRRQLFNSSVHFVEIELLRGWPRMPMDNLPPCDSCALVSRYPMRPKGEVWAVTLRQPLPKIPVPLRSPDPDAVLDLQALLHRVYDGARYHNYIYDGTPEPPLSAEDAAWAAQFVPGCAG